MTVWILFVVILSCSGVQSVMDYVDVEVEQGVLRGAVEFTDNNKMFYRFSGIPYAEPPVGSLRFKEPREPSKWYDIRNATLERDSCRSKHMVYGTYIGSEDCLYLNVYTPKKVPDEETLLPVMFWVHGGSFYMGGGTAYRYGSHFFMEEDVILVTINYRLGVLGFLNLDIPDAAGNAGLKDQVAALKWVKRNIKVFGGDPYNITVFGESAGGSCVHYLVLSDTTKGLFNKAIIQSGTAIHLWALENDPRARAVELCKELDITFTEPEKALTYLLNVPVETIVEAAEKVSIAAQMKDGMNDIVFAPVIEKSFPGHEAFIKEHPSSILKSGKFKQVSLMMGYTDGEGTMAMYPFLQNPSLYKEVDEHFEKFVPADLKMNTEEAVKKIKEFYFKNQPISVETQDQFTDFISDNMLITKINAASKLHTNLSEAPVYFYRFSFDELSFYKTLYGINLSRACHADELLYLFNNDIVELDFPNKPGSNIDKTQKRMIKLWTNFAKYGNPTPSKTDLIPVIWEKMTKNKMNYLSIGEKLETGIDPDKDRLLFWEQMYNSGHSIRSQYVLNLVSIICFTIIFILL